MKNFKLSEKMMKTNILSLAGAVLACAVLAAPAARAQTVSSVSTPTSGSVGSPVLTKVGQSQSVGVGTGVGATPIGATPIKALPPVALAGTVSATMLFMPDLTGGVDSCAYTISLAGMTGTDSAGNPYTFPAGFAVVTRPFAASDVLSINMTMQGPGGITDVHTVTFNASVTNDITRKVMTGFGTSFANGPAMATVAIQ